MVAMPPMVVHRAADQAEQVLQVATLLTVVMPQTVAPPPRAELDHPGVLAR